jgi:metallophosphoesterase superfamily enzyme
MAVDEFDEMVGVTEILPVMGNHDNGLSSGAQFGE